MTDYGAVVQNLIDFYPNALAVAIIDSSNGIQFTTDNWDVSGDIGKVMSSWKSGNAQFVNVQGVKYSLLQCTPERLIATNFGKQGHLIGAATPTGDFFILAYISPQDESWHHTAYPAVARAAAMLGGGSSITEAGSFESGTGNSSGGQVAGDTGGTSAAGASQASPSVDPNLKAQIDEFLNWIKDPQGLAYGIKYYLDQFDQDKINKLAAVYNEFRRIFNF